MPHSPLTQPRISAALSQKESNYIFGDGGSRLPALNILFRASRPPTRSPARPAPDFLVKAYALAFSQERSGSTPAIGEFCYASYRTKKFLDSNYIFGDGGSRTRVLMREIQASTGLAVYHIVGGGLAKRRAATSYSGISYPAVSESGGGTSPDCDAEVLPQSGGRVPRGYAAKA